MPEFWVLPASSAFVLASISPSIQVFHSFLALAFVSLSHSLRIFLKPFSGVGSGTLFAFISVPDTFVCLVLVAHSTVASVLVPVSAVGSVNDPTGDV